MQKKKVICAGIGVVVAAVILGGVALHRNSGAVETTAEATAPIMEEESAAVDEEVSEAAEEEPETEEPAAEETAAEVETEVPEAEGAAEVETEVPEAEGAAEVETEVPEAEEVEKVETEEPEAEPDMAEVPKEEELEEIDTYLYTTADLNMREGATTESEVIGSIPYGTKIHVTARTANNWYRTDREEVGYVSGKYLSEEEPAKQVAQTTGETSTSGGYGPNGNISKEDWEQLREAYRSVLGVYPEDMPPYDPSQVTPMPMDASEGRIDWSKYNLRPLQ